MSRRPHISEQAARARGERERAAGIDADDDAARWLAEHDAAAAPTAPKAAHKNKLLHQWRRREEAR